MVKHPVDDDPCNGDVKPNRQSPARDSLVERKSLAPGTIKRHQSQRNNYDRQNRMCAQESKVKSPDGSTALEIDDAAQKVVRQIKDQEQHGRAKGREHTRLMSANLLFADKNITCAQE